MKRKEDHDVLRAFQRLASAAEEFVNRAPRVKRIQAERSSLLDAITDAQLVLSVHRLPQGKEQEPTSVSSSKSTSLLEKQIQRSKATLNELERRLRPLTVELEEIQAKAQRAKALLDTALTIPDLAAD
jgi:small-conductance mechanosensitive channel